MLTQFSNISGQWSGHRDNSLSKNSSLTRDQRIIQYIDEVFVRYDRDGVAAGLLMAGEQLKQFPAYPRTDLHKLYDSLWKIVYGRDESARGQAAEELVVWRSWWQAQHMQELALGSQT